MSRGGFDIDDFRDSYWEPESQREGYNSSRKASRGGSSQGAKGTKRALEELREAEAKSDRVHPERKQPEASHSSNSREVGLTAILAERDRTNYGDRDTTYSLRQSEIQTLTEVGKFRVINIDELAKFAYAGDRPRLESDLRNLIQQGLLERRGTSILKKDSRQVLTLTKRGQRLIRENNFIPDDQAIYSGVVKLKEAEHDSDLYRLYQKVADEIESKGGKILRVQLDYELKEQLYRKLGRAQANGERETQRLKEAFARQMHLPVVRSKVNLPDLRIEYANQEMEISRVDLELATGHYHAGHLAEKARAGFQVYARPEDAAGLRRIRDDHEIMTSIFSL